MSKVYYAIRTGDNNQNSLKHWKYVKREKVNGKWRYYYDTKQLKTDVKDALGYDEKARLLRAEGLHADAKRKDDQAHDRYVETLMTTDRHGKAANEALNDWFTKRDIRNKTFDDYLAVNSEYRKTPLYKVERLKEKIEDAKRWLKYLFV